MVLGTCVQFWLPCTLGAGHDTLLQPWSQSVRQAGSLHREVECTHSFLQSCHGFGTGTGVGTEPHSVWLLWC